MSRSALENGTTLRVAVFGSCVSRDTCEYLPSADVVCYVARQSAIVHLHPAGTGRWPADELNSAFQAKMFNGDMEADAVSRLAAVEADVLLVDLVDERRGVWQFPDGSYLTNSVEAARAGVETWAPLEGARLIPFGTSEHFRLWSSGFVTVMRRLRVAHAVPLVFIDLDWADTVDEAVAPRGPITAVGRMVRRFRRGIRSARRDVIRGERLGTQLRDLVTPPRTEAEELAREAKRANKQFRRYRTFAESHLAGTSVRRTSRELRMSSENRWGIAPYHYRDVDYESIADEIVNKLQRKKGGLL
ncbi:DUF6270 domain-containing protein [Brevibacterium luteolum]|uniref:DUF6270 domain-containing protein n=1 Tax=Brevibacterium luteolum TaxID=199591 RepID=UPI0038796B0B